MVGYATIFLGSFGWCRVPLDARWLCGIYGGYAYYEATSDGWQRSEARDAASAHTRTTHASYPRRLRTRRYVETGTSPYEARPSLGQRGLGFGPYGPSIPQFMGDSSHEPPYQHRARHARPIDQGGGIRPRDRRNHRKGPRA